MKKFFLKSGRFIITHKIISAIAIVAIAGGSYAVYKNSVSSQTTTRYVFEIAKTGSLTSAVTGSGQISAINQLDVTSSVSGTINSVLVKAGDEVRKGAVIATIEDRDALNAVSTSELAVENDEISLQKAIKQSGTQAATSSSSDLRKSYQSGYNAIANSFLDFPTIFQDVSDIFYNQSHSPYFSDGTIAAQSDNQARSYKYQAGVLFDNAKKDYEAQYQTYKNITADSDPKVIVDFLDTTNEILKDLSLALTGTYSTIDYISSHWSGALPAQINTDKTLVDSYLSKANANMTSVSNALTGISDAEDKSISVDLDVKSAELALKQAKASLQDARDALSDHTIRAPFDGIIAKVPTTIEYGNKISNGATVATIITKKMQVSLSLNEVDASKVKVGQKVTLTFDAIEDFTMQGTVSEMDVVGTVTSGVVNYGIKVSLDSTDERIKAGMTTSLSIATGSRENAIVVPSTAISVKGGSSYVMVAKSGSTASSSLTSVKVETGLSNDTMTEILSGLNEGDRYVARTIVTAATKTTSTGSLFGGGGNTRAATGSGTVRVSP